MGVDSYDLARKMLKADLEGVLKGKYSSRCIEVIPAILINENVDTKRLTEEAIQKGVQNQLLYIFRITKNLSEDLNNGYLEPQIRELEKKINNEEQLIGGENLRHLKTFQQYLDICKKTQTPLMKSCKVYGKLSENLFKDQYELYRDGLPIAPIS